MNNENPFDMGRFFTGSIDLSKVDPDFAFTKENIARVGSETQGKIIGSQVQTQEAIVTLYKERTNQGKVLEAIKGVNENIANTGNEIMNTVLGDGKLTRNYMGNVGIALSKDILSLNTKMDISEKNIIDGIKVSENVLSEGIGGLGASVASGFEFTKIDMNANQQKTDNGFNLLRQYLSGEFDITKTAIKDEGSETRFLFENYSKNLMDGIGNVLKKQDETNYMAATARTALENKLGAHDAAVKTFQNHVYKTIRQNVKR